MAVESTNGIAAVPGIEYLARALTRVPGIRQLLKHHYRREFRRPYRGGNRYYGVYPTFETAEAAAQSLTAKGIPAHYDTAAAGRLYRAELGQMKFAQYPVLYWLERLLKEGERKVFDLGGNIGLAYYALGPRLQWPDDLNWTVHDMPSVMEVGRKVAAKEDTHGRLHFSESRDDMNGHELLLVAGTLQYLDYDLADVLSRLAQPPKYVIVCTTPMHDGDEYYTLQNLGIAICPYRVASKAQFIARMEAAGYTLRDQWTNGERYFEVPFHPEAIVSGYFGGVFECKRSE